MDSKDVINIWTGRNTQQESEFLLAGIVIGGLMLIVSPLVFWAFASTMDLGESSVTLRYIVCGMLLTCTSVVFGLLFKPNRRVPYWPTVVLFPAFLAFVGCITTPHPLLSIAVMAVFSFGGFVLASTLKRVVSQN